jgi:glyoxylase-like metal-dependent hydrolase (beta-lactamase superfamily II)
MRAKANMDNTEKISENIYRIKVRLPRNPLKYLNSYLVLGKDRNLLIDTGFHLPESYADLVAGLDAIPHDADRTDVFLTHCDSDHSGNGGRSCRPSCRVYISRIDKPLVEFFMRMPEKAEEAFRRIFVTCGFPAGEVDEALRINPALKNNAVTDFESVPVDDGHAFDLGGVKLRAILTPGHSPGHMCLYDEDTKTMFTGDHVLFDITPNITEWRGMDDSLGSYIGSLCRVRGMDVRFALPGHRESGDFYARIDGIIKHHDARLAEVITVMGEMTRRVAYDIASKMTWKITGDWKAFPIAQKFFAVGESRSHLRYLELRGMVRRERDESNETEYFSLVPGAKPFGGTAAYE